MDRHRRDIGVSPDKLARIEDIRQLTLPVAPPAAKHADILDSAEVFKDYTTLPLLICDLSHLKVTHQEL